MFYDLQQSPTVNRLEREPTYSYKDLCDLSPVDMMRVYRPREKQEEHDWEFMRSNLEAYHKLIEGRMDGMDSEKKDRYTDMLKGRLDKSEQEQQ